MLWDMQKAIWAKLTGDAPLMAKITGVFDQPPQGEVFPYIVIGEDTAEEWGDDAESGFDVESAIHVWGRSHRGRSEVKGIQADIHRLLHRQLLTVTGAHTIETETVLTESFRDPDGLTYHGVTRIRVIITPA